jgi:O-antigen/teichoic acid export membrane protein
VIRLRKRIAAWMQDKLLGRVVSNSFYLFASNAISAVLSIVTAGLLGVRDFGVLGIITNFVANINRLLSFRMSDVVVKYMGEALERGEKERAAAVVKAAGLLEALTSLVAFGVLTLLAPLGARYNARDLALTSMFVLYGLTILANITTETATGVLRLDGRFRSLALINLIQSVVVAVLVFLAALRGAQFIEILWAYLIGKMILGLGPILVALYWLPRLLGRDWWRASFAALPPWKELLGFAVSTNISGTINVLARDSEVQWVGFFFGPIVAGYYKVALALIGLITMPVDALIGPTYPEITRAYAAHQWARLQSLLKRVSVLAGAWTGLVAFVLLFFGKTILFGQWTLLGRTFSIYKPEYLPAYPVLLILLIGYGFGNLFYWNRSLLLSQGLADYVLRTTFFCMLAKILLAVVLLPRSPYVMEAVILVAYFIVSIGIMTWRGLREIRVQSTLPVTP